MWTDIHVFFEINTSGEYKVLWEPAPDPLYWFDKILNDKMKDGLSKAIFCEEFGILYDAADLYKKAKEYYEKMNLDYVMETFDPKQILMKWTLPYLNKQPKWKCSEIKTRDYEWFSIISNLRGNNSIQKPRGFPQDCDAFIINEKNSTSNGHNHSWLMVDEMLKKDFAASYNRGKIPIQIKWLKEFIKEPKYTRMVFWFDD